MLLRNAALARLAELDFVYDSKQQCLSRIASKRIQAGALTLRVIDVKSRTVPTKESEMARNLLEELYGNAVIDVSAGAHVQAAEPVAPKPTVWQMAQSATTAAATFAASGFQRVAPDIREERLDASRGCGHFDGTHCAVCGCVVAV